jgi:hypothetical protein
VINMIDQRVWRLTPEFLSYTIAKSVLWTATRTLAQALSPPHPCQCHRPWTGAAEPEAKPVRLRAGVPGDAT